MSRNNSESENNQDFSYHSKRFLPESRHCEGESSKRDRKESKSKPWKSNWHRLEAVDKG